MPENATDMLTSSIWSLHQLGAYPQTPWLILGFRPNLMLMGGPPPAPTFTIWFAPQGGPPPAPTMKQ
ncbi:MAG: hypothetical protein DLM69_05670 [Candidatus Chloroheliales bacterium]|nr:MAG: hypothetical protein DLM69_05670 [Chloroflexota bacterium]